LIEVLSLSFALIVDFACLANAMSLFGVIHEIVSGLAFVKSQNLDELDCCLFCP